MFTYLCLIRAAEVLQKAFFGIYFIKDGIFSEVLALVDIFFELPYHGADSVVINAVYYSFLLFLVGCQVKPIKLL